jgi:hypothetical protein
MAYGASGLQKVKAFEAAECIKARKMPPPKMEASEVFMMLDIEKMSVGAARLLVEESSRPYTRDLAIGAENIPKFMLDEHKT